MKKSEFFCSKSKTAIRNYLISLLTLLPLLGTGCAIAQTPAPQEQDLTNIVLVGPNQRINVQLVRSARSIPVQYFTFNERVSARLSTNEIAFVARETEVNADDPSSDEFAVRAPDPKPLLAAQGMNLQRTYTHQNMIVYQFSDSFDRRSLFNTIGAIREELGERYYAIGAVMRINDDSMPMIVTDQVILQFREGTPQSEIEAKLAELGATIVSSNPYIDNYYVVRIDPGFDEDALSAATELQLGGDVQFAHPNFITFDTRTETIPNDALFNNQWHHRNTGQSSGTVDADADTATAWDFTTGLPNVVIAVFDDGFDLAHQDLQPNLIQNFADPVDGLDNDGNQFVDDNQGWDFGPCPAAAPAGCGDNNPGAGANDDHGTAVAGSAAAVGGNTVGVTGACQNCQIMPLRRTFGGFSDAARALAFGYAQANGAAIMNNSWGQTNTAGTVSAAVQTAINNAANNGLMIFFAGGNANNAGWCNASYPSLANVVAVSSASNQDIKVVQAATGNCIDVLAPSHRGYNATDPYTGTLNATTTDRTGNAGYNNTNPVANCPTAEGTPPPANAQSYTNCFGGTSFASPLMAGIAGLVFSANQTIGLNRVSVQQIIQDTTDRIEPTVANYDPETGFSSPVGGVATHSWGRVNAGEAVQLVSATGKAGVDVFLRDNVLDWGNTDVPSNTRFEVSGSNPRGFEPHWRSVDIKVDAPPLEAMPPATHQQFESFVHENPIPGVTNRIYVRVRNRGPQSASNTVVKVHWAYAGAGLPGLPSDFWTAFPADSADTSVWSPVGTQTISSLPYSGASAAGCPGRATPGCGLLTDNASVVSMDFTAPTLDPALPNHYCLFAVVEADNDQIATTSLVPDIATPEDNNVTHRNIRFNFTDDGTSFGDQFFINNPFPHAIVARLEFDRPQGWQVDVQPGNVMSGITLQPGGRQIVRLNANAPQKGVAAEIEVIQRLTSPQAMTLGGFTFAYGKEGDLGGGSPPTTEPCSPFCIQGAWSAALFAGNNFPHGSLDNVADGDWSIGATVRYQRTDQLGIGVFVGYDTFSSTIGVSDPDFVHVSPEVSWVFQKTKFEPRVHAGIGAYFNGSSELGFNVGASMSTPLASSFRAEFRYDFRYIDGGDIRYSVLLVGLRKSF